MIISCPCCHAKYPLEAALDSEAAGELQLLLAHAGPLARPLIAYLGLFRSKTRALSFDRAVRLGEDVLALTTDRQQLFIALSETTEALRAKRDQGQIKPLSNHNYLKKVLESVPTQPGVVPIAATSGFSTSNEPAAAIGKRARAIVALSDWGRGDWLRTQISDGLGGLLVLGLDGTPAADVITRTADVWHHVMAASCNVEALDLPRVKIAFSGLLKTVEKWPEPKTIWAHMPRRPEQERLPEPPRSDESCQTALQSLAEMRERLAGCMSVPKKEPVDEEERRKLLRAQARALTKNKN